MIIKITGENPINLKENEEVTTRDIYERMKRFYAIEDAKMRIAQEECDELFLDKNNNDISEEAAEVVYEDVADTAMRILEKSDSLWDAYWTAFDEAINELLRKKNQNKETKISTNLTFEGICDDFDDFKKKLDHRIN